MHPGDRSCCGAVLPAPRAPTRTAPRSKREPDGWERQPAAASTLRSQRRTEVLHRRRRLVHHGDARSCRWCIGSPVGRRGTKKHCKGDHVPTLRPLLAVTGPPRQYGPKPCSTWPLAELQRPRSLPFARFLAPQGHRNSKTSTPIEEKSSLGVGHDYGLCRSQSSRPHEDLGCGGYEARRDRMAKRYEKIADELREEIRSGRPALGNGCPRKPRSRRSTG